MAHDTLDDATLRTLAREWYDGADVDALAPWLRAWFTMDGRERFCYLVAELLVDDALRETGYGLISEHIPHTSRRRLHLITDGSIRGAVTAHDAASRALVPQAAAKSETWVEVELTAPPLDLGRETYTWIHAVHRFLTTGEVSDPLDWTALPSCASITERHG